MAGEKGASIAAAVASSYLFARQYGPADFGRLQSTLSIVYACGALGLFASAQAISPLITRMIASRPDVISATLVVRLGFSALAMVVCASVLMAGHVSALLPLLLLLLVEPLSTGSLLAYADGKPTLVSAARMTGSAARVFWLLAAVRLRAPAPVAVLGWVLEAVVSCGISLAAERRTILEAIRRARRIRQAVMVVLRHGIRIWPAIAIQALVLRLDRIVMLRHLEPTSYGIFAAAASMIEQWNSVSVLLVSIFAPAYVYKQRERKERSRRCQRLAASMGAAALCTGALVGCIADLLIRAIYGPAFAQAAWILRAALMCSGVVFADAALTLQLIDERRGGLLLLKQALVAGAMLLFPILFEHGRWLPASTYIAQATTLFVFWAARLRPRASS